MSVDEQRALRRAANSRAPYGEAKDLIQEVFLRSLDKRRWPEHMATVPFLTQVMDSVMYARHKKGSLRSVPLDDLEDSSSSDYERAADEVNPERHAIAAEEIKNLEAHFADDEHAWCYVRGVAEGRSAKEVQEATGMSPQEYDAARKRVARYRPTRSKGE